MLCKDNSGYITQLKQPKSQKMHLDPSSRLATTGMGQKLGGLCPLLGSAGSPSNTMWHGLRPTSIPSGILTYWAIWDEKWGAAVPPFWGGGAGSTSNTMSPGHGLPPYQVASWSIQPFGHNTWAKNWEEGCNPLGEGGWSPSNTMWPGPRPTSMPRFILIHPTVWPKYTIVTDRTDRQQGEPFYKQSPKNLKWHTYHSHMLNIQNSDGNSVWWGATCFPSGAAGSLCTSKCRRNTIG